MKKNILLLSVAFFLCSNLYASEYAFKETVDPFTDEAEIILQLKNNNGDWIQFKCDPEPKITIYVNHGVKADVIPLLRDGTFANMKYRINSNKTVKFSARIDEKYRDRNYEKYATSLTFYDRNAGQTDSFVKDFIQNLENMKTLIMAQEESDQVIEFSSPRNSNYINLFFESAKKSKPCNLIPLAEERELALEKQRAKELKKQQEAEKQRKIRERIEAEEKRERLNKIKEEVDFRNDIMQLIMNHYVFDVDKVSITDSSLIFELYAWHYVLKPDWSGNPDESQYEWLEEINTSFYKDNFNNLNTEMTLNVLHSNGISKYTDRGYSWPFEFRYSKVKDFYDIEDYEYQEKHAEIFKKSRYSILGDIFLQKRILTTPEQLSEIFDEFSISIDVQKFVVSPEFNSYGREFLKKWGSKFSFQDITVLSLERYRVASLKKPIKLVFKGHISDLTEDTTFYPSEENFQWPDIDINLIDQNR